MSLYIWYNDNDGFSFDYDPTADLPPVYNHGTVYQVNPLLKFKYVNSMLIHTLSMMRYDYVDNFFYYTSNSENSHIIHGHLLQVDNIALAPNLNMVIHAHVYTETGPANLTIEPQVGATLEYPALYNQPTYSLLMSYKDYFYSTDVGQDVQGNVSLYDIVIPCKNYLEVDIPQQQPYLPIGIRIIDSGITFTTSFHNRIDLENYDFGNPTFNVYPSSKFNNPKPNNIIGGVPFVNFPLTQDIATISNNNDLILYSKNDEVIVSGGNAGINVILRTHGTQNYSQGSTPWTEIVLPFSDSVSVIRKVGSTYYLFTYVYVQTQFFAWIYQTTDFITFTKTIHLPIKAKRFMFDEVTGIGYGFDSSNYIEGTSNPISPIYQSNSNFTTWTELNWIMPTNSVTANKLDYPMGVINNKFYYLDTVTTSTYNLYIVRSNLDGSNVINVYNKLNINFAIRPFVHGNVFWYDQDAYFTMGVVNGVYYIYLGMDDKNSSITTSQPIGLHLQSLNNGSTWQPKYFQLDPSTLPDYINARTIDVKAMSDGLYMIYSTMNHVYGDSTFPTYIYLYKAAFNSSTGYYENITKVSSFTTLICHVSYITTSGYESVPNEVYVKFIPLWHPGEIQALNIAYVNWSLPTHFFSDLIIDKPIFNLSTGTTPDISTITYTSLAVTFTAQPINSYVNSGNSVTLTYTVNITHPNTSSFIPLSDVNVILHNADTSLNGTLPTTSVDNGDGTYTFTFDFTIISDVDVYLFVSAIDSTGSTGGATSSTSHTHAFIATTDFIVTPEPSPYLLSDPAQPTITDSSTLILQGQVDGINYDISATVELYIDGVLQPFATTTWGS